MICEVKDLSYSYDGEQLAVEQVSFAIQEGTYNTIIGHNGSGKSTIAKLLIGLLEAKSGEIIINGLVLSEENLAHIRDAVGIVFQNPDNQFIGSTVRDDIAFGLENHCVDPKDMDQIIEAYAREVGMFDFLEHEPTRLSGGQKQRVAIAGTLAMRPRLLILDEATSMLDPKGKKEVNDLVRKIHGESQMTIISITHDIEEVNDSDHVFVMHEGHLVMQGKPAEILQQKEALVKLSLDVPFSAKVADELKKQGIEVKESLSIEGLVDELWQLNSKK